MTNFLCEKLSFANSCNFIATRHSIWWFLVLIKKCSEQLAAFVYKKTGCCNFAWNLPVANWRSSARGNENSVMRWNARFHWSPEAKHLTQYAQVETSWPWQFPLNKLLFILIFSASIFYMERKINQGLGSLFFLFQTDFANLDTILISND